MTDTTDCSIVDLRSLIAVLAFWLGLAWIVYKESSGRRRRK